MIRATVVADSISSRGTRLTTVEAVVPKVILPQVNKYAMIRNVAESSRARPILSVLRQVEADPYLPSGWRYRGDGMIPGGPMKPDDAAEMARLERRLRGFAVQVIRRMEKLNPAKEDVNRYLEPWMYCSVILTATEWQNYFAQRLASDAQDAHTTLARAIRDAIDASSPVPRPPIWMTGTWSEGPVDLWRQAWHLPYVTEEERASLPVEVLPLISAARCGRVSYARHGATGRTLGDEVARARSFGRDAHWTPLEIPAFPEPGWPEPRWIGPLRGWRSLRKCYAGESGSEIFGQQADILPWAVR